MAPMDLTARIIRSLFDVARQYRESIDVYGTKKSFEWTLTEHEPHVLHTAKLPEPGDYCEANGAEWESQHLKEYGEYSDAIEYVNQADDYGDSLRGEWFASDDRTRTIYHGSFGNDHSPGASHYTNAEVFATEEEYRAKLAEWEALPEYLPTDDEDAEDDTDEDEEADEPQEGDYTTADHRKWFQYGRLVLDLAEDADHLKALAEHMKAGNYYPSVWFISDHGNAHRIDWILND